MTSIQLLLLAAACSVVRGTQYSPQSYTASSCSQLPVDIHAQVKEKLQDLEIWSGITEQLTQLSSQIQSLNNSLQMEVSDLREELSDLRVTVSNLSVTNNEPAQIGSSSNPATSCKDLPSCSVSGEYWVSNSKTGGEAVQVYCDMNRTTCGCEVSNGWTRAGYLDMTNPDHQCPSELTLINRTEPPYRSCGRNDNPSCRSVFFSVLEPTYTHVCGRIKGYQVGGGTGFVSAHTILTHYLSGVSLTHAKEVAPFREHIWSFAMARDQVTTNPSQICPCTNPALDHTGTIPSFVGGNYFCDTGSPNAFNSGEFYGMDPLWDGQGCSAESTCCEANTPPWFCRELPEATGEDLELRLCGISNTQFSDTPLEVIEIFVR